MRCPSKALFIFLPVLADSGKASSSTKIQVIKNWEDNFCVLPFGIVFVVQSVQIRENIVNNVNFSLIFR